MGHDGGTFHRPNIPPVDVSVRASYIRVMIIRGERPSDLPAIRSLVTAAFQNAPHASGTEAAIVDGLREAGVLTLSLVAEADGAVVGHVAFSPVSIDAEHTGWFGLGPVAVRGDMQRRGIGKALIEAGLEHIGAMGAQGCVVLGEPAYYGRFGFESDAKLRFADVPERYFQRLAMSGQPPVGMVKYHSVFY